MASLNRVMILGNLGQDPELRYTPQQTPVVTLSVATTESRTVDGQRQDQTEWHRVVVWGKQAESCAKYLSKGRSVFVEGRIQTRSWEDPKGGGKRYSTEIIAQNVKFIGGGAQRDTGVGHQQGAYNANRDASAAMGSQGGGGDFDMGAGSFGGGDNSPSLDDIPF